MKIVVILLLLLHGLIHLPGFLKAFGLVRIEELTQDIGRPLGILWLLGTLLFMVAALLHATGQPLWAWVALGAIILSQGLILVSWADAKYGTLANLAIGVAVLTTLALQGFQRSYVQDVQMVLAQRPVDEELLTEADITGLPLPVQQYLRYSGAIGKPRVFNMKIILEGQMRDKGKDWFNFSSEQYNFFTRPSRLFFMKARVKGVPAWGYHVYREDTAGMLIKLAGMFPVVDLKGPDLFPTETVTFFNELCLFAPGALIDERIAWQPIDSLTARATFSNKGTSISATLYFNETGQLTNFVSEDRMAVSEMKTFPFSTPVANYRNFADMKLPGYGEAVWHYPDGEFVYGRMNIVSVEYNVEQLPKSSRP